MKNKMNEEMLKKLFEEVVDEEIFQDISKRIEQKIKNKLMDKIGVNVEQEIKQLQRVIPNGIDAVMALTDFLEEKEKELSILKKTVANMEETLDLLKREKNGENCLDKIKNKKIEMMNMFADNEHILNNFIEVHMGECDGKCNGKCK